MNTTIRTTGLAAFLALTGAETTSARDYSIDILINPYHPGIVDSWLFDINNQGQAAGYITERTGTGFARNAAVYKDGAVQTLPPARSAYAINDSGAVVGQANFGEPLLLSVNSPPVAIEISGFPSGADFRRARNGGLNNSGHVLLDFFVNNPAETPPNAFSDLAIWSAGGTQLLSGLDPLYPYVNPPDPFDFTSGFSSFAQTTNATGLNDANQFAATPHISTYDPMGTPGDFDDDVSIAFDGPSYIYDGQGGYKLLEASAPGDEIRPIDIDQAGTVLGWSGSLLALWDLDGRILKILPDAGTPLLEFGAFGVPSVQRNNLGEVVAITTDQGIVSYDPALDSWTDITTQIAGLGTGTFDSIQGFNDAGQFVGLVRPPQGGGTFGYVVSPHAVPDSGNSAALLLVALAAMGGKHAAAGIRRRQ